MFLFLCIFPSEVQFDWTWRRPAKAVLAGVGIVVYVYRDFDLQLLLLDNVSVFCVFPSEVALI